MKDNEEKVIVGCTLRKPGCRIVRERIPADLGDRSQTIAVYPILGVEYIWSDVIRWNALVTCDLGNCRQVLQR